MCEIITRNYRAGAMPETASNIPSRKRPSNTWLPGFFRLPVQPHYGKNVRAQIVHAPASRTPWWPEPAPRAE